MNPSYINRKEIIKKFNLTTKEEVDKSDLNYPIIQDNTNENANDMQIIMNTYISNESNTNTIQINADRNTNDQYK